MKKSRFNHMVKLPGGGYVLYNFFTGKYLFLNFLAKDYYENAGLYGKENIHVQSLISGGFLVEYDELRYLKKRVEMDCMLSKNLSLTICPTLQCNFACPYCYESARPGKMSKQTMEDLYEFAKKMVEIGKLKSLSVTWYGGEPLLEPSIIETLSEKLMTLCSEEKINYRASIVTNGYHLTEKNWKLLEKTKIQKIQITLDGPDAATHNRTRYLKNGSGSFERIMENLQYAGKDCMIAIRCNVQKNNVQLYQDLEKRIDAMAKEKGINMKAYAGFMNANSETADIELDWKVFADLENRNAAARKRYRYCGPSCMYSKAFGFVIDERGELYKCWDFVGKADESLGNVKSFDPIRPETGNTDGFVACLESAFPQDEECLNCKLLPCCMGGCFIQRKAGRKTCKEITDHLDEYVIEVYKGGTVNGAP